MTTLYPTDIAEFLRKFRFTGARLRRFRYRPSADGGTLDVVLVARKAMQSLNAPSERVILTFEFRGVEEYRFQRRPGPPAAKSDCRFGTFNGLVYADFDAFPLGQGEVAKLHDFRASDAFVGGREVRYAVAERTVKV
jgi:hypothetical protein